MTIKLIWRLIWKPTTNDISLGSEIAFLPQGHRIMDATCTHFLFMTVFFYVPYVAFTQFCLKYFFSSNRILMTESFQFFFHKKGNNIFNCISLILLSPEKKILFLRRVYCVFQFPQAGVLQNISSHIESSTGLVGSERCLHSLPPESRNTAIGLSDPNLCFTQHKSQGPDSSFVQGGNDDVEPLNHEKYRGLKFITNWLKSFLTLKTVQNICIQK